MKRGVVHQIFGCVSGKEQFTIQDAYQELPEKPKETVRVRIYETLA